MNYCLQVVASSTATGDRSEKSLAGPLSDKSAHSIMSNVEMSPSRRRKLEGGLGIGLTDDDEMKSHSVGNLSSVSVKSLGIHDRSPSKREEDDKGEDPDEQGGDEEDIEKAESIGIQYTHTHVHTHTHTHTLRHYSPHHHEL